MSATTYGWLVLAFPLAGSIVIALGWRSLPGRTAGWIGSAAIGLAFLNAIAALIQLQGEPAEGRTLTSSLWDYAVTAGVDVQLGILVDPLAVFMALVVSGASFLIHVYSVAYMDSDRGYRRYFSYLNFFVFSMLLLVLAGNFVILIVGWAFVGFASYALDQLLVPAPHGHVRRHEGVRHQRRRGRGPRLRGHPDPARHGLTRLSDRVRACSGGVHAERAGRSSRSVS